VADSPYRRGYLKLRSVLHDRTTALPAFPLLIDDLRAALDDRRVLGVLHVETEGLDQVESLYGWQVLDRVLARLSAVLDEARGEAVPQSTLLAIDRVAGDRFVAFLPDRGDGSEIDNKTLREAARRLRRRLEASLDADELAGLGPRLTFRVGHAMLSQNPFFRFERQLYGALREAQALPKKRARRRVRSWGDELQRIIREGAMRTVFQPVVDLRSGGVLGYEAFARGPKDTPLEMPNEMFAVSTQVGVEADLDRACREAAARATSGARLDGKLFLNSRQASLDGDGFPGEALGAAADLVFEFSEREADADPEGFADALSRLKQRGFSVALDDVGTGYGSQTVLERVRPDYLKLDVSLVRDIDSSLIKQEILHSLVRIAGQLDAAVIAEGVETAAEAQALLGAGAGYGQGHHYASPLPLDSLAAREPGDAPGLN